VIFTIVNPQPRILGISPTIIGAGSGAFVLTVNGADFVPDSSVRWNGSDRQTTFDSSSQLRAAIPANLIATGGSASITVFTPGPGGGTSNALTFTIVSPPIITGLSPASAEAGSGAFTLDVFGTGFTSGSIVRWNGMDRFTVFMPYDSGQFRPFLRASILASDIAVAGTTSVTVFNPGPGGSSSASRPFTITNPVPSTTGVIPGSVQAGGPAFSLAVNGVGFVSSSMVQWNGSDRPTTFVTNTQLRAEIPAGDIAMAGTANVTVFNREPGGGISNPQTFTITNPVPGISSLNPNSAQVGGPAFPLTVNGTGFVSSSRVRWNGSDRLTNFVSSTQLAAEIPASDITVPGTAIVTVFNPAPGGGTSNPLTFTIVLLIITTPSPLPDGTVGTAYSQQLAASGGSPPYSWSVGSLPPGLTLNPTTGVISGAPTDRGSFNFAAQVTDTAQRTATKTFDVAIEPPALSVTTPSPLPTGMEGTAYSQQLAATGGTPPYTWALGAGSLPDGLNLNSSGLISGTPTGSRTFNFTAQVTDNAQRIATRVFDISIDPTLLTIQTPSPLRSGTAGIAYSQTLTVTGGTPPYTWTVSAGSLPAGLNLNSSGLISGTPASSQTFNFTAQVTDNAQQTAARIFDVTINPTINITDLPDSTNSREQPRGNIVLSHSSQSAIRARLALTFTPDANLPDDPLIQFSVGGRVMDIVLTAGRTEPSEFAFQSGTVAGVIRISVTLESGGIDITPSPPPTHTVTVNRRPPVITSVSIGARTASSFEVVVVGYSNTRAVSQGIFRFTARAGSTLQTESIPIDLTNDFSAWYGSPASLQVGGQFRSVTSFTVQGDINAISSVSVTLTNGQGTSEARSINF